ncbi:hypothetical protein V6N12_071041 [Hibiscus sabdariffa]|uniref:Uncharacterized protein n=1 Tax=Hibiscus sabdariffa TaxID=183260 RepID=A0ABR2FIM9_9ROSI
MTQKSSVAHTKKKKGKKDCWIPLLNSSCPEGNIVDQGPGESMQVLHELRIYDNSTMEGNWKIDALMMGSNQRTRESLSDYQTQSHATGGNKNVEKLEDKKKGSRGWMETQTTVPYNRIAGQMDCRVNQKKI